MDGPVGDRVVDDRVDGPEEPGRCNSGYHRTSTIDGIAKF